MLYFFLVILLVLFIGGAVFIHKLIQQREQVQKKRQQMLRKAKSSLNDVAEIIDTIKLYDGYAPLIKVLYEFLISEYETINRKYADDQELLTQLQELKALLASVDDTFNQSYTPAEPDTDRQIAIYKRHGLASIKLLKQMVSKGNLSQLESEEYVNHIRERLLKAEVKAYLNHGDKAEKNADKITAAQYYKHAKEVLVASDVNFDEKTAEIKRISKMVSALYATPDEEEKDGPAG